MLEQLALSENDAAPWFVVPADNKWFTRLVVVAAIVDALENLDLKPNPLTETEIEALNAARVQLLGEAR